MLRIGLINQKGGGGKSTTAVLLALAFARAGHRVGLVDKDPVQGTLTRAAQFLDDGAELYRPGHPYRIVFYDAPGSLELPEVAEVLAIADKIIVPTGISSPDLSSTAQTVVYLRAEVPETPKALLFVGVDRYDSPEYMDEVARRMKIPRFQGTIPHRKEFQRLLESPLKIVPADRAIISGIAKELMEL